MANSQLPIALQQEQAAIGKFHRFIAWISHYAKQHEILIIAALAAVLVFGLAGKVQDIVIAHDKARSAKDNVTLASDVAKTDQQAKANADLAQKANQLASDYQQLAAKYAADNSRLEKENAALNTKLHAQQAADAKLPPPELAARIVSLAGIRKDSVIPKPDNSFSVAPDGAVGIAQALENLPVLQTQLANVKLESDNKDKLLAKRDEQIGTLNQRIGGLENEIKGKDAVIADWQKKYKDDTKTLRDQARRSKGKWFIAGYIAGLATKPIIKILGL